MKNSTQKTILLTTIFFTFLLATAPASAIPLYSIDVANDRLVIVETQTGSVSIVGSFGVGDVTSGRLAVLGDRLFMLDTTHTLPILRELDPNSGAVISSVWVTIPSNFDVAEGFTSSCGLLLLSFKALPQRSGGANVSNAIGVLSLDGTVTAVAQFGNGQSNVDLDFLTSDSHGQLFGADQFAPGGGTVLYHITPSTSTISQQIRLGSNTINQMLFVSSSLFGVDNGTGEVFRLARQSLAPYRVPYTHGVELFGLAPMLRVPGLAEG